MEFYTETVKKDIPKEVTIVAATKYFTSEQMRDLYKTGISHFGENRVELLKEKIEDLKDLDIKWHIIGTLQTKKVKKIINDIDYLHSLDNIKLAQEVNKRREQVLPCFVQVNISDEESKHGLELDQVIPFIEEVKEYPNIQIIGLMGMAMYTNNEDIISNQFQKLNDLQKEIKNQCNLDVKELSIGMSNDYLVALKHNATYLRLGSVLFRSE